jgi:hypothetical protein
MKKSILYFERSKISKSSPALRLWNYLLNVTKELRLNVIFPFQLNMAVAVLNFFGNKKECKNLMAKMSTLPDCSLGKKLFDIMQANRIELVPWYKEHDLKHVLLGYKMDTLEEMRMQCFMWGNAGFSVFTTIITFFFIIWTPEMWSDAKYHFNAGKLVKNVTEYKLESTIERSLESLRIEIELAKGVAYFNNLIP